MNKVILIGRLTQDPEMRHTQSGIAMTRFTLAVDRPYTNQQGEREADFIDIVTWRKLAEICANNLGKGRLVAVDGRLQVRSYDDRQGVRRKAAEIVANEVKFLDWPRDSGRAGSAPADKGGSLAGEGFGSEISLSEEEIPF